MGRALPNVCQCLCPGGRLPARGGFRPARLPRAHQRRRQRCAPWGVARLRLGAAQPHRDAVHADSPGAARAWYRQGRCRGDGNGRRVPARLGARRLRGPDAGNRAVRHRLAIRGRPVTGRQGSARPHAGGLHTR